MLWRFLACTMRGVGGLALDFNLSLRGWYIIFPAEDRMERNARRKEVLLARAAEIVGFMSSVYHITQRGHQRGNNTSKYSMSFQALRRFDLFCCSAV